MKNGGSLIECLYVLPSIAYEPIGNQIDGILGAMEDHLPKYLMPAISLIRRSFSEGILDADEIYRPTWGPLKSDPLQQIALRELKDAVLSLAYREQVKDLKGPWPKIIGEIASLINYEIIPARQGMIAYILMNLRIPDATSEIRQSITHLAKHLLSNKQRKLNGFRKSSDPYELTANAISSLSLRNESLLAANLLLLFLKKSPKCRENYELANFFQNNILNYSFLISRDRTILKSRTGIALLSMIQQSNTDIRDIAEQLFPFEYTSWRDLLLAFINQLRRHQSLHGKVSDILESIYGDLMLESIRKHWQLLRNRIIMQTVLSTMAKKEHSTRIRRLLTDISTDRSIQPEVWRKALAFGSPEDDVNSLTDAALKMLKALLVSELLPSGILKANIAELVNIYNETDEIAECSGQLQTYLASFTHAKKDAETDTEITLRNMNIEDLLLALPNLDVYTDEYRSLKNFLSQSDLETKIGKVDLTAHPTRGRLLTRLLQMAERAIDIEDNIRSLAKQFVDYVVYEGYGAGTLSRRSN